MSRADLALKVRKSVDKAVRLCRGVYPVMVTNPATEPLTNSRPMDDAEPFNGSIPFTGLDALLVGDLYLVRLDQVGPNRWQSAVENALSPLLSWPR